MHVDVLDHTRSDDRPCVNSRRPCVRTIRHRRLAEVRRFAIHNVCYVDPFLCRYVLRTHDTSPMTNEVLKEKTLVAVRTLAQLRDKAELLSASNYRCLVRVGPSLAALRAVECHRPLPVWQATARRQAIRTWEDRDQRMLREKERADAHKAVVAELIRYGERLAAP